jgi:hypothetical protein
VGKLVTGGPAGFIEALINVVKTVGAINMGLPFAEQIQVGSVQGEESGHVSFRSCAANSGFSYVVSQGDGQNWPKTVENCSLALFRGIFSEFNGIFTRFCRSGLKFDLLLLWRVTKAPFGAALILNNENIAGSRSPGQGELGADGIVIGLDIAEKLIGFGQAFR